MDRLLEASRRIDALNERIGTNASWLVLAAVLVSALNALARYGLNASSNAWLEMQSLLFGAVFLLGGGYTLLKNEHIRIDIVNGRLPARWRLAIDLFGHVFFILPLCLILIWSGGQFFLRSLMLGETSSSAGGLLLWPGKLLVPVGFALLLAQAFSETVKRVAAWRAA